MLVASLTMKESIKFQLVLNLMLRPLLSPKTHPTPLSPDLIWFEPTAPSLQFLVQVSSRIWTLVLSFFVCLSLGNRFRDASPRPPLKKELVTQAGGVELADTSSS